MTTQGIAESARIKWTKRSLGQSNEEYSRFSQGTRIQLSLRRLTSFKVLKLGPINSRQLCCPLHLLRLPLNLSVAKKLQATRSCKRSVRSSTAKRSRNASTSTIITTRVACARIATTRRVVSRRQSCASIRIVNSMRVECARHAICAITTIASATLRKILPSTVMVILSKMSNSKILVVMVAFKTKRSSLCRRSSQQHRLSRGEAAALLFNLMRLLTDTLSQTFVLLFSLSNAHTKL